MIKEESLKILKLSFIWKALEELNNFNHNTFINKFSEDILIEITNNFIKDCLYDDISHIENKDELFSFYETWSEYFKEISDNWKKVLMKEVDRVYERSSFNIENKKDYKEIVKDIWYKIKNKK